MPVTERENWIYSQVLAGNIPDFLRMLVPVSVNATINGTNHSCTYYVTADYLAVGPDTDYFLTPMTPLLAQRLCDALGGILPTRKMVNQIWTNAAVKLSPQPIAPSAEMITVPVFAYHNEMVRAQRHALTNSFPLGALVSGDKKDVIVSTKIYTNFANAGITKPVVIYGWHYQSGSPIQPLYNGHEETYADYSHGIRLVQNALTLDGTNSKITDILTNANLAALLSDEGVAEGTSPGVIRTPRYTISSAPPALLEQPRSQRVLAGASASFRTTAVGAAPLAYRWRFNGADIPGATNALLTLTNLAASDAGNYTVVVTNNLGSTSSRAAWLRVITNGFPIVFADNFEINTATNWNLFWGAANNVPDYTVDWTYDHNWTPCTFNGVTSLIPPGPNAFHGSSRVVRLTVNNNDTNAFIAGVNIYPKSQSFGGDFALKFDLWMNYPGGAGGINSTGSTQHALFGVNHLGTQMNWAAVSAPSSDGLWFAVDGEGGTSRDYRAYEGNLSGTQTELIGLATSGLSESNNSAAVYLAMFPSTGFETGGSPGKNWVEVELRQTNNWIYWLMDGVMVAQRTNNSQFTMGTIMLGVMDIFSSIANPAEDLFVLVDNVRVEELTNRVRFLSANRATNGQVDLRFSGVAGQDYLLEWSSNLVDWQATESLHCSNAPLQFSDVEASNWPTRFYRIRQ